MSEPENIQCFNAAMRLVLVILYDQFPKPFTIDTPTLLKEMPEACQLWAPLRSRDNYVAATVRFLRDENFLRHAGAIDSTATVFPNCVLTSKGFTVLNLPSPSALSASEGNVIQTLKGNLSVSDVGAAIQALLQLAFKFLPGS